MDASHTCSSSALSRDKSMGVAVGYDHRQQDETFEALKESFPTLIENPQEELEKLYFERARAGLCHYPEANAGMTLHIAYTAMHGLGHVFTSHSFAAFGLRSSFLCKCSFFPTPNSPRPKLQVSWRISRVLVGYWEPEQHIRLKPGCDRKQLYFIVSTVPSKMPRAVAQAEGLNFEQILIDFK
ncbi:hypothetical protein PR003_g9891 [Phytophthora rubi]|uniref:Uncharacterized protein n=1 Tax=Phytophthora rubi TaxID=129364 RepID=A0A6A4FFJ8_9STRA|nr:hypothetical protein PR003_g9891 [Phytophthora rubi]